MKYFVEEDPTRLGIVRRYHILKGKVVVAITTSRPDGKEVERPSGVKWAIENPYGSPVDVEVRRVEFHNVPGDIADEARRRAGEAHRKRVRWNGGRR